MTFFSCLTTINNFNLLTCFDRIEKHDANVSAILMARAYGKGAFAAPDSEITSVARKGDASRVQDLLGRSSTRVNYPTIYPTCITRRSLTSRSVFLPFTLLRVPYDEYCRAECGSVTEKPFFIREKL